MGSNLTNPPALLTTSIYAVHFRFHHCYGVSLQWFFLQGRAAMKLAQSKYYICYQGFTNASKYNWKVARPRNCGFKWNDNSNLTNPPALLTTSIYAVHFRFHHCYGVSLQWFFLQGRAAMKLAQSKYYICYQGFTNESKYNCSLLYISILAKPCWNTLRTTERPFTVNWG